MSSDPTVLHTDNHLLVVHKPAGTPAVPDESGDPSLLDDAKAWIKRTSGKPGNVFLGVVQRLDRPVSGVMVFARTSKAASRLADQFRKRSVQKSYLGIGAGTPPGPSGKLTQILLKDRTANRVHVLPEVESERSGAREAVTRWRLLASQRGTTLLEFDPLTGRPHQLRVAAASLGCPLLGDLKYGAEVALADRSIALHAYRLTLQHPTTKETLTFTSAPPPTDWWQAYASVLDQLVRTTAPTAGQPDSRHAP